MKYVIYFIQKLGQNVTKIFALYKIKQKVYLSVTVLFFG